MTAENKEQLLKLLQQYKSLGISEQIDYEKSISTLSLHIVQLLREVPSPK